MAIGADGVDVLDLADSRAGFDAVAETVIARGSRRSAAGTAVRRAPPAPCRSDTDIPAAAASRSSRGRASDCRVIDGDRRHARAERGAQVAFVHRVVVAIPVEVHALARLLVPERGKSDAPISSSGGSLLEVPVELNRLVGIERVHAAAAPPRHVRARGWARCGCAGRASGFSAGR